MNRDDLVERLAQTLYKQWNDSVSLYHWKELGESSRGVWRDGARALLPVIDEYVASREGRNDAVARLLVQALLRHADNDE